MFSFKKGFKRKFAVVFCLIFIVLAVVTTHAGAASGGGGGSSRGSASGGGGGSSRSSASGGGGSSSSSSSSGSSSSGSSSSSSGSSGGSSSSSRSSSRSGGSSSSSSSGGSGLRIGRASGGGGTGIDDDNFTIEDLGPGYEISNSNGHGSGNSVSVNSGSSTSMNRGSSASGSGNGQDDMSSLSGYVPSVAANAYSNSSNMSGVMMTNGVDNKFVVTSKDGQQTSEYLKDWAVLTTSSGSQGWYHFDNNGNMSTGFINDSTGNTYYMIESGENKGMMAVGTVNINGIDYTFSNGSDGRTYGALVK